MILILNSNVSEQSHEYQQLLAHLATLPGIQTRVHIERGSEKPVTTFEAMLSLPCSVINAFSATL